MTDNLHVEIRDGIAEVTLNRPRQRNALTFSMYERLLAFCEKAARDGSLRAVMITGAGDNMFPNSRRPDDVMSATTINRAMEYLGIPFASSIQA